MSGMRVNCIYRAEMAVLVTLCVLELLVVYGVGRRLAAQAVGWAAGSPRRRLIASALLGPGTVIHESAHALACVALGGRVGRFVPFRGVRDGETVLGYVEVAMRGPVSAALVGVAPLWLGAPIIWAIVAVCLQTADPTAWHSALADVAPWRAALAVFAVVSGALALAPSPSDHHPFALAVVLALCAGAVALVGSPLLTGAVVLLAPPTVILLLMAMIAARF